MNVVDLTHVLHDGVAAYPGDPGLELVRARDHSDAGYHLTDIHIGSHVGTHIDVPLHVVPGGADVASLDPDALVGPAQVVDAGVLAPSSEIDLDPSDLDLREGGRLLIRTGWSSHFGETDYYTAYPRLSPRLADAVADARLALIGLEQPSLHQEVGLEMHHTLLGAGVTILESVRLTDLDADRFTLVVASRRYASSASTAAPAGCSPLSTELLPADAADAVLVGRVDDPDDGPCVVTLRDRDLVDITRTAITVSRLLEADDPVAVVLGAAADRRWPLPDAPPLLSPVDLQVIKAAGVTFVESMLERVIEERAAGDPAQAERLRSQLGELVGGAVADLVPGSVEAAEVKRTLQAEGLWSQYLEVGIGPDPEIFTKAPVLSSVGPGAAVGVLASSRWNNPEPELVLVADSRGRARGATLGNDVNLRDVEGRSALLLGRAKDNNASCAIGPFVRLFDERFTLDVARQVEIDLEVVGRDGFVMRGTSSVGRISRPFEALLGAASGRHHQCPDGFVLFTGTLFAPTQDRGEPGAGFTHAEGDVVTISAAELGALRNTVTTSEAAPPWTVGIGELFASLARRGLS